MPSIAVMDYGSGNLHSVSRAIDRVGGGARITGDPAEIERADALVIPGVGHFGSCVRAIRSRGLDVVVRDFRETGRPVFGVCVGMQVLFEGSDEDAEVGLGVLAGWASRLPDDVKVPHMGWNTVTWIGSHAFVEGIPDDTRFYFVHSYAPDVDPAVTVGVSEHGRTFGAAVACDNVFATQFHPEKSGEPGLQIYERFVQAVRAA
jgi:imidazole glycerol-phosphate synthase subunit HisH